MRTPSLYVGGKVQGFSVAVIGLHCFLMYGMMLRRKRRVLSGYIYRI